MYYRNSLNVLERGEGGPVDANGILQNELAVARSPESQRKRRAEEDAGGSGQHKRAANAKGRPVAVGAAVASVAPARTTQLISSRPVPPVPPPVPLMFSSRADEIASQNKSEKNLNVSMVLAELSRKGTLQVGAWKDLELPRGTYGEMQSLKNALELCFFVCTSEEATMLRNGKDMDDAKLTQLSLAIEKKAFMKMWEFEGKNAERESSKIRGKGSRANKPTYLALGPRVREYKQELAKFHGLKDYNNEKLCPRPEGFEWTKQPKSKTKKPSTKKS